MREFAILTPEEEADLAAFQSGEPAPVAAAKPPELGTVPNEEIREPGFDLARVPGEVAPPQPVKEPDAQGEYPIVQRENSEPAQFARSKNLNTEASWYDNPTAVIGSIADGLMWGWADEAMAGMVAGLQSIAGEGEYDELYDKYYNPAQAARDKYADEHPYIDFLGNVIGGIATGGPAVAAGKAIAKSAVHGAAKLGGYAGLMAAEGGIAGAGSSREGERLEGAGYGAAGAVALGGAMVGAGKGIGRLVEGTKEIKRLKVEGGPDMPLHLAAPEGSARQGLYQTLVGNAWGGRKAMRKQHQDYMEAFYDRLGAAAGKILKGKSALKRGNKHRLEGRRLLEEGEVAARNRKVALTKAQADNDMVAIKKIAAQDKLARNAVAVRQQKEVLDEMGSDFRDAATHQSKPIGMDKDAIMGLMGADSQARQGILNEAWASLGFGLARGKTSNINVNKLLQNVMESIDDVGGLSREGKEALLEMFGPAVEQMAAGKVSGETFIAVRTQLSKMASSVPASTPDAKSVSFALRRILGNIDDAFGEGVKGDGFKAKWAAEKAAYRNYVTGTGAANKAKDTAIRGDYTPNMWVQSAAENSSKKVVAQGDAPLQKLANGMQEGYEKVSKEMADSTAKMNAALDDSVVAELASVKATMKRQIEDIKKKALSDKNTRRRANIDIDAEAISADAKAIAHLEAQHEDIALAIKAMEAKGPMNSNNLFAQQAATYVLWAVSGGALLAGAPVTSVALSIAGGTGMAKLLSKPGTQRLIAGQLGIPMGAAGTLIEVASKNLERTRRATTRAAVMGSNTGEDN